MVTGSPEMRNDPAWFPAGFVPCDTGVYWSLLVATIKVESEATCAERWSFSRTYAVVPSQSTRYAAVVGMRRRTGSV